MPLRILLVSLFCLLAYQQSALARDLSAEIININYPQKIAFIDLGKDDVNAGDIFSLDGQQGKIYFEVVETSEAVSKIGVCLKDNFKSAPGDFDHVAIGATAIRVFSSAPPKEPVTAPVVEVPPVVNAVAPVAIPPANTQVLQATIDQLPNAMQVIQTKNQQLEMENANLKKKMDDMQVQSASAVSEGEKNKKLAEDAGAKIKVLKEQLDKLTKIVEERIKK